MRNTPVRDDSRDAFLYRTGVRRWQNALSNLEKKYICKPFSGYSPDFQNGMPEYPLSGDVAAEETEYRVARADILKERLP